MARVSIIDDNATARATVVALLRTSGAVIDEFADASSFLKGLHSSAPDCLVTEYALVDMSGVDLLTAVHRRVPALPVIFLTDIGDVSAAVSAIRAGAFDYTQKPYHYHLLQRRVLQALSASE